MDFILSPNPTISLLALFYVYGGYKHYMLLIFCFVPGVLWDGRGPIEGSLETIKMLKEKVSMFT